MSTQQQTQTESGNTEKSETLLLDEKDELYGYGIMNVGQDTLLNLNQFGVAGSGYHENDTVVGSKKKLKRAFATMVAEREDVDSMKQLSSFRVVQVRLDNSLDGECVEIGDKVIEMAESDGEVRIDEVVE